MMTQHTYALRKQIYGGNYGETSVENCQIRKKSAETTLRLSDRRRKEGKNKLFCVGVGEAAGFSLSERIMGVLKVTIKHGRQVERPGQRSRADWLSGN